MKIMIALATALIGLSANAKTIATYTKDGATYTVEQTSKGVRVHQAACNHEMDLCFNEGGKVPAWLTNLNDWAAEHGGQLPVEACGEINQCPNEGGKVPNWMHQLNQWFLDHGFSTPADDIYVG